jgi:transaldolase
MKFFIDSANLNDINEAKKIGILDGVTTNPTLISKEKISGIDNVFDHYRLICDIVEDKDVSVEIISTDFKSMISEGEELSTINSNIVLKIPIIPDGLEAISYFNSRGIKTNCTLVFSVGQAVLAAKAGATYVSVFIGRLDDISNNSLSILNDIRKIYDNFNYKTCILAASIRNSFHIIECAKRGIDIITSPLEYIKNLIYHPMTDLGLDKFLSDYELYR